MHPPAPEGKGELINRKVHGFCKLCWAKCPVYDLEMVRGAQGKHHGKESLRGFPDLRKTQRLLKEVLSEGRFVAVLQVSCLSS